MTLDFMTSELDDEEADAPELLELEWSPIGVTATIIGITAALALGLSLIAGRR